MVKILLLFGLPHTTVPDEAMKEFKADQEWKIPLDYHTFLSENLQEERRGHLNIQIPSRILNKMEIFPLGGIPS